ncbi:hypothetical protein [Mesorhizobium sp. B4-1-4]|uniref:hypothetical protein n=1 Tax=Mesorhizobium sp. B4-1-4 TaxID=2589888 RepID=UPI00112C08E0|nr:hypothetical protein [Mesorhizobium sp. B4-1-4]UCI29381.1 hypothetical protein FJW03_16065 [Mesorhizobium sp. B4-1-4]
MRLQLSLIDGSLSRQYSKTGEAWLRRVAPARNLKAACRIGEPASEVSPAGLCESQRGNGARYQVAARALASLYLCGNGVAHDADEGMHWLLAPSGGNRESQVDLANFVLDDAGMNRSILARPLFCQRYRW